MIIDAFFYLFITPVNLALAIIGSIVGLALRRTRPELSQRIVKSSWLLMASLLITGFLFTECWSLLVFGKFYEHFDYLPSIDCSPFWLNPQYGTKYFHGTTKHLLFALWGLYALLCWGSAAGMAWWFMNWKRIKKQRTTPSTVP